MCSTTVFFTNISKNYFITIKPCSQQVGCLNINDFQFSFTCVFGYIVEKRLCKRFNLLCGNLINGHFYFSLFKSAINIHSAAAVKSGGVFNLKTACFCAILYITLFLVYKERKRYDLRYERPARYV